MTQPCTKCPKKFSNGASLNFHFKKVHSGKSLPTPVVSRNDTQETKFCRPLRGRPGMIKFGRISGIPDFTKGPFKVSNFICPRRTVKENANENNIRLTLKSYEPVTVIEPKDTPIVSTTRKTNGLKSKRKSTSSDVTSSDTDNQISPPKLSPPTNPEPEMPVLSPQASPNRSTSGGRPGPKRSKKGKHWKYNEEEYDMGTSLGRKRRQSNETSASDTSICSSSGSRTRYVATWVKSVNHETNVANRLNTSPDNDNDNTKNQRNNSTTSPVLVDDADAGTMDNSGGKLKLPRSISTSSVSVFEDSVSKKSTTQHSGDNDNSSQFLTIPGNKEGSETSVQTVRFGKNQPCPICGQTGFKNHGQFTNHLEIHEGKRPYVCPICSIGYETDFKLLEHVSIRHSQEAKFTCPTCGVNYKVQRAFENHKCS